MAVVAAVAALALAASGPAYAGEPPNDPGFSQQWGDENTGQAIPTQQVPGETLGPFANGTVGADDSALAAWQMTTGSPSIVIGEVDTGIEYTHPDLAQNIWTNPGGVGGCAAGTHGFNMLVVEALPESCEPRDKDSEYDGHGTHVAGILGAVGNNGVGVAGMNWRTTILPVKWIDQPAHEEPKSAERLVKALRRLRDVIKNSHVNIRVVNDSDVFRGTEKSSELRQAIRELGEVGVLFVAAAGNNGMNENTEPTFPCGFSSEVSNEICVTATNNADELPSWANYGSSKVQLAAPGASILSTLRGGSYGYLSGGSMAAAQVSGAAALILSSQPWLSVGEVKADILSHVDSLAALAGKVETGGRLDVCRAIPGCQDAPAQPPPPPPPPPQVAVSAFQAEVARATIRRLKVSPLAFKAARSGPAISSAAPAGTLRTGAIVSYRDTMAATTEFTVFVLRSGVLGTAHRCVAHPGGRRAHARLRPCIRALYAGRFTHRDRGGVNKFRFSGHLGHVRRGPGSYRLRAVPMFSGVPGTAAVAGFRITG